MFSSCPCLPAISSRGAGARPPQHQGEAISQSAAPTGEPKSNPLVHEQLRSDEPGECNSSIPPGVDGTPPQRRREFEADEPDIEPLAGDVSCGGADSLVLESSKYNAGDDANATGTDAPSEAFEHQTLNTTPPPTQYTDHLTRQPGYSPYLLRVIL